MEVYEIMDLKITKITDKVEGLDIKGQGCADDCKVPVYANSTWSSCDFQGWAYTSQYTKLW